MPLKRRLYVLVALAVLAALPGFALAAATFDADHAAQPYLATLSAPAKARSDAYFEGGEWLAPLTNTLIRVDESEADAFGLNAAREPDGFASAAMKLSAYRKIAQGALEEMPFFDHPSGRTRVYMAMQWKKDHAPNAAEVVPPPLQEPKR